MPRSRSCEGNRPIGWSRSGGSRFQLAKGGEVGECGRGCSVLQLRQDAADQHAVRQRHAMADAGAGRGCRRGSGRPWALPTAYRPSMTSSPVSITLKSTSVCRPPMFTRITVSVSG